MSHQPAPGYGPPRRQGRPWWIWALFGCSGCFAVVAIASIILGGVFFNTIKSTMKDVGPVDAATVQQSLGEDVPTYPGATLDLPSTTAALTTYRFMEKNLLKKEQGSMFAGAAVYTSPDAPDKVAEFYERELKDAGWTSLGSQSLGFGTQHQFRKGKQFLTVQIQKGPEGTQITVMRGGAGLAEMQQQQGSPAGAK